VLAAAAVAADDQTRGGGALGHLESERHRRRPEPGQRPEAGGELVLAVDLDALDLRQGRAERARVAEPGPDLLAPGGEALAPLELHRDLPSTPLEPPSRRRSSSSKTRSAGLCVSVTRTSVPSASWIALAIVPSGAPPPSPIPFAPFLLNG